VLTLLPLSALLSPSSVHGFQARRYGRSAS